MTMPRVGRGMPPPLHLEETLSACEKRSEKVPARINFSMLLHCTISRCVALHIESYDHSGIIFPPPTDTVRSNDS